MAKGQMHESARLMPEDAALSSVGLLVARPRLLCDIVGSCVSYAPNWTCPVSPFLLQRQAAFAITSSPSLFKRHCLS